MPHSNLLRLDTCKQGRPPGGSNNSQHLSKHIAYNMLRLIESMHVLASKTLGKRWVRQVLAFADRRNAESMSLGLHPPGYQPFVAAPAAAVAVVAVARLARHQWTFQ